MGRRGAGAPMISGSYAAPAKAQTRDRLPFLLWRRSYHLCIRGAKRGALPRGVAAVRFFGPRYLSSLHSEVEYYIVGGTSAWRRGETGPERACHLPCRRPIIAGAGANGDELGKNDDSPLAAEIFGRR